MHTFTLFGRRSVLHAEYNPPILLDDDDYELGLINFETYNAIPNVDENNNTLVIGNTTIKIPVGAYEIDDINKIINSELAEKTLITKFNVSVNNNTLKCVIKSNVEVKFNIPNSIGSLFGFKHSKILDPHFSQHESEHVVNILKVNIIKIECNIIYGAYSNTEAVHTIHEFFPSVPPGYKIIETPRNVIYMPLNTRHIDNITLKIVDQDGKLVNFREELVTIRLHLRRKQNGS